MVDGPVDAQLVDGPPPTACVTKWLDGTVRFGTIATYGTLNTTSFERDPFVSHDELTIYWSSNRGGSTGGSDVYKATRANTTTTTWASIGIYPAASTDAADSKMSMTDDELYLVVSTNKNGTSNGMYNTVDVKDATRSATSMAFSSPLGTTYTSLQA